MRERSLGRGAWLGACIVVSLSFAAGCSGGGGSQGDLFGGDGGAGQNGGGLTKGGGLLGPQPGQQQPGKTPPASPSGTATNGTTTTPPANQCTGKLGTTTCAKCMEQACCTEAAACVSAQECGALLQCAQPCTDDACIQQCAQQYPNGVNPAVALSKCVSAKCQTQCQ